jgi:S1-C subfamily serine protease
MVSRGLEVDMPQSPLLQQISAEREALIASVASHAVAVAGSRRRVLSGIHWRGAYVITAAEAIAGADRVRVSWSSASELEESAQGEVVAADLTTDVAVIRTERSAAAEIATRENLRLGEGAMIAGRDAHGPLVSWGVISVAGPGWRSRRGGEIAQRIEIAAPVDDRLEGALVADTAGRIAAMLVSGPRGRALGIPASTIERVLRSIERHGYLPQPYLGVRLQTLWIDSNAAARFGRRSRRAPVVAGVEAGSPAAGAGLEPGDLIETIGGQEVDGIDGVMRALGRAPAGDIIEIGLRRGGELQSRSVRVGERPCDAR